VDVVAERATAPPPYHGYATITGAFVGSLALAGGLARLLIAALTRANELER
jgi:hypothetical protein